MKFFVRYWVAKAPVPFDGHKWDDSAWINHSAHPSTHMGLHNAILSAEDRLAVLRQQHDKTPHGCEIFVVEGDVTVILSVHEADSLLAMIEHGNLNWKNLGALLTAHRKFVKPQRSLPQIDHEFAFANLLKTDNHTGFNNYLTEEEMADVHNLDIDA